MDKILRFSIYSIINFVFTSLTGYYIIDIVKIMLPFSNSEVSDIKLVCGIIVAVFTSIFWLARTVKLLFLDMPFNKREKQLKEEMMKLENEIKRNRMLSRLAKEDFEEILKRDNESEIN